MKSGWRSVQVGDICSFNYGKALPAGERNGGATAVYGSNGIIGYHDSAITVGKTIVIGRKGSFGEVNYSEQPCWPIDTAYYIDEESTKEDMQWLAYRLSCLGLNKLNKSAAVPGLNRDDAYRQELLLPPLAEQRRIAAILGKADAVRAKRRDALAQIDSLAQSIFMEMFGKAFSQGWDVITVGEMGLPDGGMRTGPFGSQLLHSEFVDDGIAVLGIDNAVANEFRWSERRFITERKYRELKRYTVRPGDVLITIMGTCGRCAVVPDDIPLAINTKHLCCISLDTKKCLPEFLHAFFLRHPAAQKYLEQTAKGAIMSGLNMGIIKAMPIPLVPLDLQQEFAKRQVALQSLKDAHSTAQTELNAMFASLQHKAFLGEI